MGREREKNDLTGLGESLGWGLPGEDPCRSFDSGPPLAGTSAQDDGGKTNKGKSNDRSRFLAPLGMTKKLQTLKMTGLRQ